MTRLMKCVFVAALLAAFPIAKAADKPVLRPGAVPTKGIGDSVGNGRAGEEVPDVDPKNPKDPKKKKKKKPGDKPGEKSDDAASEEKPAAK